jgi:hypothetical protein
MLVPKMDGSFTSALATVGVPARMATRTTASPEPLQRRLSQSAVFFMD